MHRKTLIAIAVGSILGTALPRAYAAAGQQPAAAGQQPAPALSQDNQQQAAASANAEGTLVPPQTGMAQDERSHADNRDTSQGDAAKDQRDVVRDRRDIKTDRKDVTRDREDIRTDQRDIKTDRKDIARDRADIRTDQRDIKTDRKDMARDRADVRADQRDIKTDRKDMARDRADMRADRQDIHKDRHDLRADRGDLRSDFGNVRTGDPGDRRTDWQESQQQDQRFSRNNVDQHTGDRRMDGTKPGMTAATVANNAAENNKKAQNTQKLHKAWYHFW
jgi:hypothetical protein